MSAETSIRRRPDGSIDTGFYASCAVNLRDEAHKQAVSRVLAALTVLLVRRAAIGRPARIAR